MSARTRSLFVACAVGLIILALLAFQATDDAVHVSTAKSVPTPTVTTSTTVAPTTTTTTEPVVVAQAATPPVTQPTPTTTEATPEPETPSVDAYTSMEPCGGDLPPCYVKWRESHGNYQALNASSGASGAWQFMDGTWAGYGGYSKAMYAPPEVQDQRAREVWNGGAGCSAWSACGGLT